MHSSDVINENDLSFFLEKELKGLIKLTPFEFKFIRQEDDEQKQKLSYNLTSKII